jgi:hypothetical protein
VARELYQEAFNRIRLEVEKCESFDSFLAVGHLCGASSGGLIQGMNGQFEDMKQFPVMFYGFPSPNMQVSHMESYNTSLNLYDSNLYKSWMLWDN